MSRPTVVLVCGGRDNHDRDHVHKQLSRMHRHYGQVVIITGACAGGVDPLAELWAYENDVYVVRCPAQWGRHGKAAGPMRNAVMAALRPDVCLAFKGGPGTADMVAKARAAGIETYQV